MKLKVIPFLLAGTALLAGCQQNANTITAPSIQKEDAAAVVNGHFISKSALETLTKEVSERARGQNIPVDKLLDELIKRQLLVEQAKTKKLDQTPEMIERLAMMQSSVLSQAAVEDYMKANPVSEADLKAEYDKQIGGIDGDEFKARHILVKTVEEAKALIAELDKGANFVKLAETKSEGPSKDNGGDLGWFSAKQMVAPFSEAVAKLANGAYTKEPVQTQFGWHVILREESRKQTPPPFDAVKAQLEPLVQREKLTNYLDSLRNGAQVEILVPLDPPAAEAAPATEQQPENEVAEVVEEVEITEQAAPAPAPEENAAAPAPATK